MSKRIIFLDFDGVLNNQGSWILHRRLRKKAGKPVHGAYAFMANPDPVSVALIDRLLDLDDRVRVVVSSSWRMKQTLVDIKLILKEEFGMENYGRVIGMTPVNDEKRGRQIAQWIAMHGPLDAYVILDDDDDMLPEQAPHFIQTSFNDGFTWAHYEKVKKGLKIKKKEPLI